MMNEEIRGEAYQLLRGERELSPDPQRAYLQLAACKAHVSSAYSAVIGSATFTWRENQAKYERWARRLGALESMFEDRCREELGGLWRAGASPLPNTERNES